MVNKSIAYRLSVFISLAVIVVFISFILLFFLFAQSLLKENIENHAIRESSRIILQVEQLVSKTKEITSNISEQIVYYDLNDNVEMFLKLFVDKYPFLNSINVNIDPTLIGFENHHFISFRENGNIRFAKLNKPCFRSQAQKQVIGQVLKQKGEGWTKPYHCPGKELAVVSYIVPIEIPDGHNGAKRIGEVICELSLLELNNSVCDVNICNSKSGYAFMVAENGDYITHPKKERILKWNLFNVPDTIYKSKVDLVKIATKGESGTLTFNSNLFGREKTWAYYTPVKDTGWFLFFVLPYSELFQPLYFMLLRMLFFSVVGVLIIYFLISFITNKMIKPLSSVTSQLKNFSKLSGGATINTHNEVKLISESLDYLKGWFDDYRISQSREQKKSISIMQDLELASEIQHSLIKTDYASFRENKNIDLYAIYKPVRVVSGDLFDYFFVDDDNLVVTVGDVSGHGIPAALFMGIAQTIIKSSTVGKRAKNIVWKANEELFTNNRHQFFLTLFVGVLNIKTGVLNYCNAAHTTTLIRKKDGEIVDLGFFHGLPLGLYSYKAYRDKKIQIEKGDKIILYSDGITEQLNDEKKQLGLKGFKNLVSEIKNDYAPEKFVKELEQKLNDYRGGERQTDDITLFVIQY